MWKCTHIKKLASAQSLTWFRLLAQVKKSNETALNTGMTDTFLLEHPTAIQTWNEPEARRLVWF